MSRDSYSKRLELAFKKWFKKFITGNLSHTLSSIPQDLFSDVTNILILRHDRIGDLLVSVPFLKALRTNYPNLEITILLSEKNYSASRAASPYVNNILVYKKGLKDIYGLLKELNRKKFDLIIDLFDNPSATSDFILKFVKSRYKLGIDKDNRNNYSHIVPLLDKSKNHIVDRINQLLLPFNIDPSNIDNNLSYNLTNDEIEKAYNDTQKEKNELRIGINLSGSSISKFWGEQNYIEFINLIKKFHSQIDVILFTTGNNKLIADNITMVSNAVVAPLTSNFDEFASYINTCDVLITPDTSVIHLCSAFKIPVVALYEIPESNTGMHWFPRGVPFRYCESKGGLNNIKPTDVFDSLKDLIKEIGY